MNQATIESLRSELLGTLLQAGDKAYDHARRVHNGMIDRHPALIARCLTVADVVDCVRFAVQQDLEIAIRGGGHNVAGRAVCDGGMMIDLSAMKGIYVDPVNRLAQVQGGVTWGELNRETQLFALATTGGLISSTGVAGLTLGGGFGFLSAKHGMSIDKLAQRASRHRDR